MTGWSGREMSIKNERDLQAMRPACVVARKVLDEVSDFIQPGVTTREIDQFAAARIKHYGAKSAFLGYKKYPCNLCISVNEQVVHGLANNRRVEFGDIISLDVGVIYNGFIGDTARTGSLLMAGLRCGYRYHPATDGTRCDPSSPHG